MSAYTTWSSVTGRIPQPILINALNDGDLDGSIAQAQPRFNQIVSDVSGEIDGYLSSVYPVPYNASSIPPAVANACLAMVCSTIMGRRLAPPQLDVWTDEAEKWRSIIKGYGEGVGNLGPSFPKAFPPGLVSSEWASMDMTTA